MFSRIGTDCSAKGLVWQCILTLDDEGVEEGGVG